MVSAKRSARSSTRKRAMSARVREVDEGALASARMAAVNALEDDAVAEEAGSDSDFEADAPPRPKRARRASIVDEPDDERPRSKGKAKGRGAARANRQKKILGIARHNKALQNVLDAERGAGRPEGLVAYEAIAGGPGKRPARKLCSVCGHVSPYTCTRCGAFFCSLKCGGIHDDTRCLKFTIG